MVVVIVEQKQDGTPTLVSIVLRCLLENQEPGVSDIYCVCLGWIYLRSERRTFKSPSTVETS